MNGMQRPEESADDFLPWSGTKRPFRDNFASIMPLAHLSFLSLEGNERLRTDAEDEKIRSLLVKIGIWA